MVHFERFSVNFRMCLSFLLIVFVALFSKLDALSVHKVADGKIETFVEPVKLQGISFTKRYLNRSMSASVKFVINSTVLVDDLSFHWLFDGSDLKVTRLRSGTVPDKLVNVYSTESVVENGIEVTLHLKDKGLAPGNYTLIVSTTTGGEESALASGFVLSAPILPLFPKDRRVLEGDRLLISCEVTGYPKPTKVAWRFAPIKPDMMKDTDALVDAKADLAPLATYNTSGYQFITQGVSDDQLLFSQLPSEFNGLYECSVEQNGDRDESLILVNVKDRWAALWPFIGIVIEVTVVVAAILLYERHQMRSKPSKTDNTAVNATPGIAEAASPVPKQRSMPAQQQHNNVDAVGDLHNEATVDGDKGTVNPEGGDNKQDEVRLRGTARC